MDVNSHIFHTHYIYQELQLLFVYNLFTSADFYGFNCYNTSTSLITNSKLAFELIIYLIYLPMLQVYV